ncbi:MAG TPA: hypothetical protein VMY40_01945, partial [Anaerolineae bacterium]|nr:hypothetical protein [Anaerolineae bacterium]
MSRGPTRAADGPAVVGAEEQRSMGAGEQKQEAGSRNQGGEEQGAGEQGRRGEMEDELAGVPTLEEIERHPMDHLLRTERLPHIWCPGCGLGTALSCFT